MRLNVYSAVAGTIGSLCFASTAAHAQTIQPGQSVADRARPDYDSIGTPVGSFNLYPSVTTSIDATDNYRASDTNREGDVFFTIQPQARLASDWGRHRVNANAYYARSFHIGKDSENISQYGASTSGVYDISRRTSLRADLSAARASESRTRLGAFRGSLEPVRYDSYQSGLAITQDFDPLMLSGQISAERVNYHDTPAVGGGFIDQDFRDLRVLTVGGSTRYDMRNGIGLLVSGQYSRNDYDFGPGSPGFNPLVNVDRHSNGIRLQGGVSLELSKLIIGNIQIGYINRNYRDPRLRDSSGLSFDADVLWNVTGLTSVRFTARRSYEETSSQTIAGNRRNDFGVRVDHELYRNIILNADANYGTFSPDGPGVGGNEYSLGLGARYLINRRFTVTAGIRHSRRDSDSTFLRYHATSGGVGLRFAL